MSECIINIEARDKLMRKLEHLEAMTLLSLTGLDGIADFSRESYLAACHEVACECGQLAGEAFGIR